MLVLNVGAHKSGSTWLDAIIRAMPLDLQPPPVSFGGEKDAGKVEYIGRVAAEVDPLKNYCIKHHFARPPKGGYPHAFNENPGVCCVNIVRDFHDVLVSYYYHHCALRQPLTIEAFFDAWARFYFDRYVTYNHFWLLQGEAVFAAAPLNVFYEDMLRDFQAEASRLAAVLGVPHADLAEIERRTTLDAMRESHVAPWMRAFGDGGRGFFRAGRAGGYRMLLTRRMTDAIEQWQNASPHFVEIAPFMRQAD